MTSIGEKALTCYSLVKVNVPDGNQELKMKRAFLNHLTLEELSVGNNVKELDFRGNIYLKKLSFGTGMEKIKLIDCPPLLEINALCETAPDLSFEFYGNVPDLQLKLCKIHVPVGCSRSYIAKGWDRLGKIVPDLEIADVPDIEDITEIGPTERCIVYSITGIILDDDIPYEDIDCMKYSGIVAIRSKSTGKTEKRFVGAGSF